MAIHLAGLLMVSQVPKVSAAIELTVCSLGRDQSKERERDTHRWSLTVLSAGPVVLSLSFSIRTILLRCRS